MCHLNFPSSYIQVKGSEHFWKLLSGCFLNFEIFRYDIPWYLGGIDCRNRLIVNESLITLKFLFSQLLIKFYEGVSVLLFLLVVFCSFISLSWNHRMAQEGRDLKTCPVPRPCCRQGCHSPDQTAQGPSTLASSSFCEQNGGGI